MKKIFLISLFTLCFFPLISEEVVLKNGNLEFTINTETFAATAARGGFEYVVSTRVPLGETRILEKSRDRVLILIEEMNMTFTAEVKEDHIDFSFRTDREGEIQWPQYRADRKSRLIWMKGDGRHIPQSDRQWIDYLKGEHGLTESPLWGHSLEEGTAAWIAETPFRNSLIMNGRDYSLKQTFLVRRDEEEHRFRLALSNEEDPLLPGRLYRSYLMETGQFISYEEKIQDLPEKRREWLEGAIHIYLWGRDRVSVNDVKAGQWKALAQSLLQENSLNRRLRGAMDRESLDALREVAESEWPFPYIKSQLTRGISEALDVVDPDLFYRHFSSYFRGMEEWGHGVSPAFVRELKSLGIDRARLTVDEFSKAPLVGDTVRAAEEAGYLFGIYDSYHSIHPVHLAGTDDTWSTAQFTQELFEEGTIMRKDGSFYSGFKGRGRHLNPIAARPAFEERVSQNLAQLPLSFYFIDCDAAGEIYEDYNPRYSATSEESAQARRSRLNWLRSEKELVVGSEGGNPFIVPEILISEGPFSPVFTWEDPDFRDRESPYFVGRYWPPAAPEINFKEIPLKDHLQHRYFDPTTRIPLFQVIFHDSVLTTNHWGSDMFKFESAQDILQLQQMLYLSPPLYNLNRERLAEKSDVIMANYRFFSPLHKEYGFSELESFEVLSSDGLLQKTHFAGGLEMVVNFSEETYSYKGTLIAPMTAAALERGKAPRFFSP